MNHKGTTAEAVTAAAENAGVSVRSLADEAGLPYTTLWRKMRGRASFTVEDIAAIAQVLEVDPVSLAKFPAVA